MTQTIYAEAIQHLGNAVIVHACNDYFHAARALRSKKRGLKQEELDKAQEMFDEVIEFFYSDAFSFYSSGSIPPCKLIDKIEVVVANKNVKTSSNPFSYNFDTVDAFV